MTQNYREKCLSQKIAVCWNCGSDDELKVHHIDGDRDNNVLDNLIPLCNGCHGQVHVGKNLSPTLQRLRDKLPDSAVVDHENKAANGEGAGRYKNLKVTPEVFEQLQRDKDSGQSWSHYLDELHEKATEWEHRRSDVL